MKTFALATALFLGLGTVATAQDAPKCDKNKTEQTCSKKDAKGCPSKSNKTCDKKEAKACPTKAEDKKANDKQDKKASCCKSKANKAQK